MQHGASHLLSLTEKCKKPVLQAADHLFMPFHKNDPLFIFFLINFICTCQSTVMVNNVSHYNITQASCFSCFILSQFQSSLVTFFMPCALTAP